MLVNGSRSSSETQARVSRQMCYLTYSIAFARLTALKPEGMVDSDLVSLSFITLSNYMRARSPLTVTDRIEAVSSELLFRALCMQRACCKVKVREHYSDRVVSCLAFQSW